MLFEEPKAPRFVSAFNEQKKNLRDLYSKAQNGYCYEYGEPGILGKTLPTNDEKVKMSVILMLCAKKFQATMRKWIAKGS
uniref:Uncharacterized protein n=1 Tax=Sphaerodactylus townsendi TaxID=933632 RepID=A0ACB8FCZ5_9SAUR